MRNLTIRVKGRLKAVALECSVRLKQRRYRWQRQRKLCGVFGMTMKGFALKSGQIKTVLVTIDQRNYGDRNGI